MEEVIIVYICFAIFVWYIFVNCNWFDTQRQ